MKKRIISVFLAVCMICALLPAVAFAEVTSGTCGENIQWSHDKSTGKLTISCIDAEKPGVMDNYYGDYWTPWLEDFPQFTENITSVEIRAGVQNVGDCAFILCTELKSVTIPESVKSIGENAFGGCESLESIAIPESVKSIGDGAFYWCKSLKSVVIPEGVKNIEEGTFAGCSLESITIPESVTSIGDEAFSGCDALESITIPESVTSIGDDAFFGCDALKSVTIPGSVMSIGDGAFYWCESLKSVTIREGVKIIGEVAFHGCGSLESVTIPGSVMSIGKEAFAGCSLESIIIPESVTSIGEWAFAGCSFENVTIPGSITSIGDGVFYRCGSLKSITIPESVTSIGDRAFWDCGSLENITIPGSVRNIGLGAFYDCGSLKSIIIQESVTSIGGMAFDGCGSLESVTIPKSVETIGDAAFRRCNALNTVYYSGTEREWNSIQIGFDNYALFDAEIKYNSKGNTPVIPNIPEFNDVATTAYYADAVSWAVQNNITVGTGGGNFSPDYACTRANIVTFLWRAAGSPEPTITNNPFTDVKSGEYYYKAVLWAVENGITVGISEKQFGTDGICTRSQIVTFLWRANDKPVVSANKSFSDVPAGAFYAEAVNWAVKNNITVGVSETSFAPSAQCSRAQCVTFLYRTFA